MCRRVCPCVGGCVQARRSVSICRRVCPGVGGCVHV